jgi:hypothetical protein
VQKKNQGVNEQLMNEAGDPLISLQVQVQAGDPDDEDYDDESSHE